MSWKRSLAASTQFSEQKIANEYFEHGIKMTAVSKQLAQHTLTARLHGVQANAFSTMTVWLISRSSFETICFPNFFDLFTSKHSAKHGIPSSLGTRFFVAPEQRLPVLTHRAEELFPFRQTPTGLLKNIGKVLRFSR